MSQINPIPERGTILRKMIMPVVAAVACLLFNAGEARAAGGIHWGNSLTVALAQAKKTGRLVMVDFYTDWCGYCKKLDAETYTDPAVIRAAQPIIAVKLNAERDEEGIAAAKRLGVHSFPAIYFLNASGEIEGHVRGYQPPAVFLQSIQGIEQVHRDLPGLQSHLRARPNDLPTAAKLTAIYASLGRTAQANAALAQVTRLDPNGSKGSLAQAQLSVAQMCMRAQHLDPAITLYQKAARSARNPEERAVAHINLAICYGSMHKFDITESELNTTLAIPNCPAEMKQAAQQLLARVQQIKGQGHP